MKFCSNSERDKGYVLKVNCVVDKIVNRDWGCLHFAASWAYHPMFANTAN